MTTSFKSTRDIIIRTNDFQDAKRFYQTVLGLAIVHATETLLCFDAGAFRLYIEQGSTHGAVFEFLVPDFETAKAELLASGCTIVEENSSVPRCYIRDPYGLVFNIRQRDATR
jgi:catechol 2,3-dioxygenase-like lactoylglutathione lyase family enzyme